MTTAANPETRLSETIGNLLASGCVWTATSGLAATMTAGVVYVNGKRVVVSLIASRTFTASKDTYVTVDENGTVSYSEVANGASVPSLPANSVWLAKVVTDGSAVTSVTNFVGWSPFSPTWSNLTVGNGTLTARYEQIRKTVRFSIVLVWGSTTSVSGTVQFTLPVPPTPVVGVGTQIGSVKLYNGTASFHGPLTQSSTTQAVIRWYKVQGTGIIEENISGTSPDTWNTGDEFHIAGSYEAA